MSDARMLAWQGWRLVLPRRWDPIQLAGTAATGHVLLADALRPRLGLRWQTPGRRAGPAAAVRRVLAAEVGDLAAAEATPRPVAGDWASPLLYVEPAPPGRDVWVGYSRASGRVLSVVHHVRRRDRVLAHVVLPTLDEVSLGAAAPWSVFDLSVVAPADFALVAQRLNAGDLSLTFADRRGATFTVRQIAVAELALRRLPLDGWIADQEKPLSRVYRSARATMDVTVTIGDRTTAGRSARLRRRRRFTLAAWHARELVTVVAHDVPRDRLVIVHGPDDDLLRAVLCTAGVDAATVRPTAAAG